MTNPPDNTLYASFAAIFGDSSHTIRLLIIIFRAIFVAVDIFLSELRRMRLARIQYGGLFGLFDHGWWNSIVHSNQRKFTTGSLLDETDVKQRSSKLETVLP